MLASAGRQDDPEKAVRAIRAIRRRELFRIAAGDLLGADRRRRRRRRAVPAHRRDPRGHPRRGRPRRSAQQRGLDEAPDPDGGRRDGPLRRLRAVLRQRRRRAVRARAGRRAPTRRRRRRTPRPWPTSCAGCWRCPAPTRRWRSTPTCGPRASRARWCAPWTPTPPTTPSGRRSGRRRRCCAPTRWSGDLELRERFAELIDPLRFPARGHLRRRRASRCAGSRRASTSERLPRGADPQTHLKLGRGGLADIEWTVQLLQMRYAGQVPGLRTSRTLEALDAAREAGLLAEDDAAALDARLAHGQPDPQRDHAGRAASPATSCRATRARRPRSRAILGYPPGALRRDGQRLPAHHPARARRRGPGLLGVMCQPSGEPATVSGVSDRLLVTAPVTTRGRGDGDRLLSHRSPGRVGR